MVGATNWWSERLEDLPRHGAVLTSVVATAGTTAGCRGVARARGGFDDFTT